MRLLVKTIGALRHRRQQRLRAEEWGMSRSRPLSQPAGTIPPAGTGGASGGAAAAGLFSRINPGRISAIIVDQIRLLMRQGQLQPGDRLPAERELCEDFGVSRVTVREALRVLEANGLVEIRVGARGGTFVRRPSKERVGEGIADYLTMSSVTSGDVTELRMVLELGIIPLVCERATDDDVDELLLPSLQGPLLMSLHQARQVAPEMGKRGAQEHLAFVEAVKDRDVATATEIMRAHLERTASRVRREDAKASRVKRA